MSDNLNSKPLNEKSGNDVADNAHNNEEKAKILADSGLLEAYECLLTRLSQVAL